MEGQKDRVSDTRGPRGEVALPHWFVRRGLGHDIECHRERVGRRRPHSHPLGQRSEKEKEREREEEGAAAQEREGDMGIDYFFACFEWLQCPYIYSPYRT